MFDEGIKRNYLSLRDEKRGLEEKTHFVFKRSKEGIKGEDPLDYTACSYLLILPKRVMWPKEDDVAQRDQNLTFSRDIQLSCIRMSQ